jgi:hypothetical protein
MSNNAAWGPSRSWSWGDYGRYELSYYSRARRTRNRWEFSIAGSGSAARTPWGAALRARRFYRSQRSAS